MDIDNRLAVSGAADLDELRRRLAVHEPGTIEDAPSILSFDRARTVELPWADLIREYAGGTGSTIAPIRSYFEASWPVDTIDKNTVKLLVDEGYIAPATKPSGEAVGIPLFVTADLGPQLAPNPKEEPDAFEKRQAAEDANHIADVTDGVVLRHGASGRTYLVLTADDDTLDIDDFVADYDAAWARVLGVEQVHAKTEPQWKACRDALTTFEMIDLRAPFIVDRFNELQALKEISALVSEEAKKAVGEQLAGLVFDDAAVDSLRTNYLNARMGLHRVDRQLRKLRQQAADMGYVLLLGDEKIETNPDGTPLQGTPTPGNLYRRRTVPYTWKVKHSRAAVAVAADGIRAAINWLFGGGSTRVRTTYETTETGTTIKYDPVDVTTDLLAKRSAQLEAAGRIVMVLEETDDGYVARDGSSLETIMARCDTSEEYRRACSVMVPDVETSLSGERVVTGYRVFHRPLPGLTPITFPELAILERLSYRTAWRQAELGEFVTSTTLAPGETRTVTVTRSFEREMTTSETRASVFDLSTAESSDLATEMERTTRTDNEFSIHASASAEASFGFPGGSASGKMEAGTSNTLKTFGENISKTARKAARSINQNQRQEVTSSTTEKTTVSSSDTTSTTIENINAGRTLNLMFYKLYNRFEGSLYLEHLKLRVTSGVEIIAGSGIRLSKRYGVARFDDALAELSRTPLPVDFHEGQIWDLRKRLLDELETVLAADYQDLRPSNTLTPGRMMATAPPLEPESLVSFAAPLQATAPAPIEPLKATQRDIDKKISEFDKKRDELTTKLAEFEIADIPVVSNDILVATRGLYLDAQVGLNPGTEPYSEQVRTEEIRHRQAETDQLSAAASLDRARAGRLSRGEANRILAIVARDKRTLDLQLEQPLPPGDWHLELDGQPIEGNPSESDLDATRVELKWRATPEFLKTSADLSGLALVDGTGARIETGA